MSVIELGSILNIARTSGDLHLRGRVGHWMENCLEKIWRVKGNGGQSGLKWFFLKTGQGELMPGLGDKEFDQILKVIRY